METCVICRAEIVSPGDVAVRTPRGRPICLQCWNRDTPDERRMPAALERQVREATKDA